MLPDGTQIETGFIKQGLQFVNLRCITTPTPNVGSQTSCPLARPSTVPMRVVSLCVHTDLSPARVLFCRPPPAADLDDFTQDDVAVCVTSATLMSLKVR